MRHLFLLTDIEGAAGVTSWDQTRTPGPALDAARGKLTDEVNAFVEGLLGQAEAAAQTLHLTVWDGHGYGGLHLGQVDPRCTSYPHDHPGGIAALFRACLESDPPMDALAFVGQHAMEGSDGNLSHTYSSRRVKRHRLNGVAIGEFGTRALHAWALGVPTVFLSGDDVACAEAKALIAGIDALAVKRSLSLLDAECLTASESRDQLRAAGARLIGVDLGRAAFTPRIELKAPFSYTIEYKLKWGLVPKPRKRLEAGDLLSLLSQI